MASEGGRYASFSSGSRPAAGSPDSDILVEVGPSFWRNIAKWSVAFLFFCALAALLVSLMLFQVTAEGASKRTLRRAVAALSEIDVLIERNYDDLQQRSASAGPNETVELRDFPLTIPLSRQEVAGASRDDLRDLLLNRSAEIMYGRGTDPLRAQPGSSQDVGAFSEAGITDNGLGFLRSRYHDILGVLTFALAALCVFLGVTLAALCRGFGRLASVGGVVLAAAIPLVLAGIGARFYMRIVSDSDTEYIQREFLEIGQGLAWIPIRNGLAFTVLGAVFLVVGVLCAMWADRREAPRYSAARPGSR
jgi:hypothetical protein